MGVSTPQARECQLDLRQIRLCLADRRIGWHRLPDQGPGQSRVDVDGADFRFNYLRRKDSETAAWDVGGIMPA
jgi:hypothetical protein